MQGDDAQVEEHARWCVQFVEHHVEPIARFDAEGRYLYVNPSLCKILGMSREALMEAGPGAFLKACTPESIARVAESVQQALVNGAVVRDVVGCHDAKGCLRWSHHLAQPWYREDGRIGGLSGMGWDITEYCEAELSAERMREQLTELQRLESLGTLAGGVAHDFNNLLQVILSSAELLRDQITEPPHADHLDRILGVSRRARELSQRLLAFARRLDIELMVVDPNVLVNETLEMCRRTLQKEAGSVQFDTDLAPHLPEILVDSLQLERALLNLCSNACDAMPDGGTLSIETRLDSAAAGNGNSGPQMVRISVRDTGCGIPESNRDRIFEPFFTTKPMGCGTGLGLAVVHGTICRLGGRIELESSVGVGTIVSLLLPVADSHQARTLRSKTEPLLEGRETLLIVDDEPLNLVVAEAVLARLGYRVHTAHGGQEALDCYFAREREIDLVLLDLIMPKVDGRTVLREIRRRNPTAKVIIVSGYGREDWRPELERAGCVGFVNKPYLASELSRMVRCALDAPAED